MADYKGEINDHTVVYVTAGGNAPKGVYDLSQMRNTVRKDLIVPTLMPIQT